MLNPKLLTQKIAGRSRLVYLLAIILQLIFILYFQRNIFRSRYNTEYWKDRYEHSQYVLPLSQRLIGDDGLYAYSGYRLVKGDNPFSINVDKPPLGKYLIGLSIIIFHNPIFYSLILGIGSLVVFYLLTKLLIPDSGVSLAVTAILFLDPLFFSQLWTSTLDISQLFFLLLNIYFIFRWYQNAKADLWLITFAGLALGLFAETKPPILLPLIFSIEMMLVSKKKISHSPFYLSGIALGIILPYSRYLALGHNLIDVLKVHKFMLVFYQGSKLITHKGAILESLFWGKFPNIGSSEVLKVTEWWSIWPFLVILSILTIGYLFFHKKKAKLIWISISLFTVISLIIYSLIPSYPRYLVIVLPFLYLLSGKWLVTHLSKRINNLLFTLVITYGLINSFGFLYPTPRPLLNGFYYNLEHRYFHDIYEEDIDPSTKAAFNRNEFRAITQSAWENASIKRVDIKELNVDVPKFGTKGQVAVLVTYHQQNLGSFSEKKVLRLFKINGQWKIKWDWNLILNGYQPNYQLETVLTEGKRGEIISSEGKVIAEDGDTYLISLNPEKMDTRKEQEMLTFLSNLGRLSPMPLQNGYLENVLPGRYVPLFTIFRPLTADIEKTLRSYPGLKFVPYHSRIYSSVIDETSIQNVSFKECCSRIYSSLNYHGVSPPESTYDQELSGYDGGKLIMKDKIGNIVRTILEKNAKIGKDVSL